ncbi:glutathione binding-like protein [Tritonibacter mobilis]|uniref:glutathione binding-like protein n=1 Tax=Tritonibacter mobilis TaxID=379347 RepID=UPI001D0D61DC|nr:glutathione binding-like protein [Tritonibacter mobilis]
MQYIADSSPEAGLAPAAGTPARARMQEHLNWIGTELHKAFGPLFREGTSKAGKDAARTAVAGKFDFIETQLVEGREWLVEDQFSVADAYLFVVSNWANFTGIDLARWPNLAAFVNRSAARRGTDSQDCKPRYKLFSNSQSNALWRPCRFRRRSSKLNKSVN